MKPRRGIPLADAAALRRAARRTTTVRSAVAAAVAVLAAAALAAAPASGSGGGGDAGGLGTVAVLDVSGSITDRGSNQIQHALGTLEAEAGPGGRIGLVLFSDTALEALPPTAPARELERFRRFFIPLGKGHGRTHLAPALPATVGARTLAYPQSPWGLSFSGGTDISSGLLEARAALARAGMHGGRVVLLSDLVDSPQDEPALRAALRGYANDPRLDLEVRRLQSDEAQPDGIYRRILGPQAVRPAQVGPPPPLPDGAHGTLPVWLIVLTALGAAALAADELLSVPLRWRSAEAAT